MEKKDFPKGTKPREIFVYTCERIAEPLNRWATNTARAK